MSRPTAAYPPYGQVLRLEELLQAARVHDEDVDRVLFLATHQSCEISFAVVLRHLEAVRAALDEGEGCLAVRRAAPLPVLVTTLVGQFDALATLSPGAFESIRTDLGDASGLQSAQYREIEYLCGLRDARFVNTAGFRDADRKRLLARLEERSVQEAYRDYALACADREAVEQVRAALLDFDEAFAVWRARHAVLAERFLGGGSGTAGSDGASYLWRAARRRLLPDVWPGQ
ncbi:tryptophan 2,3-dioxygenase family protein [Streptomyces tubbatahanensis]|uniref:Tryptophan 2,3-dioxygenase family protein n=1 Tax=Streptomyces tubbatahanensis TaxID=2923272 RepID=A0ABY3XKU4_9ACTN|nr:tryptophan 2,3-dioxygenase family protein [Streptomyces tubbatahanensis]UNS95041.1 tryptophan 2,3-dioxygenase family protein [Streptomyces tubbatahanensis]